MIIISILSGVILVTVGSARKKAVDARVQADMELIDSAKGMWQTDNIGQSDTFNNASAVQKFDYLKRYLPVTKTYTSLADLQPTGVTYCINNLGVPASHIP